MKKPVASVVASVLGVIATVAPLLAVLLTTAPARRDHLSRFGVRERGIGAKAVSKAVSAVEINLDRTYRKLEEIAPYVNAASMRYGVPREIVAAILFEEILHRKPIDIATFGVAQLGVGELEAAGLPQNPALLENDEISVWLLARKIRRLRDRTGSIGDAVTLHNGYYDFRASVFERSRDPLLLGILNRPLPRIPLPYLV